MPFNLGERSFTINIKNFTLDQPENTVFHVKDYKGEDYYRGTYYLPDIKKLNDEEINISFNTLHCNHNLVFKLNPNNYQKYVDVTYKYNNKFNCVLDIKPESFKESITITSSSISPYYDISLNDLQSWNFGGGFIFGLFLIIAIMINRIDKKGLLLNNKNK